MVLKLPKALLQQHCQKLGWAPPRFEKLPLGGGRLPTASLRYSVTLEPAQQGKVCISACKASLDGFFDKELLFLDTLLRYTSDNLCSGVQASACQSLRKSYILWCH